MFLILLSCLIIQTPAETQAAEQTPEIKRAIQRGVSFMQKTSPAGTQGALSTYAMIVGGADPKGAAIQKMVGSVAGKVKNGKYSPGGHLYEAGVDMMLLEAVDPVKYHSQLQAMAAFIMYSQKEGGHWFYPGETDTGGDTSISQYALLGLWAAARSGIEIPTNVWDNAAAWHVRSQLADGSHTYHPPTPRPASFHAMTAAGIGSLHICRLHLHPGTASRVAKKKTPKKSAPKFNVLEKVDRDTGKSELDTRNDTPSTSKVRTQLGTIQGKASHALGWLGSHFQVDSGNAGIQWPMYYLYALERAASLAEVEKIGGHDWYKEVSDHLLKIQKQDGSWDDGHGQDLSTSLAVLFLARATGKLVARPAGPRFGAGDMEGSRDLAKVKDFSQLEMRKGKLVSKEKLGKLDDLLLELDKPRINDIGATTDAIVNLVNLGEREALVGKRDLLLKLARDPRPEARRVALWALGRTSDFEDLALFMKALEDPNIDVVVEANYALCWINRNPQGVGVPNSPLAGVPEDATDAQRQKAMLKWQADARKRWKAWYIKIRPYKERNDLLEESGR